MKRSDIIDLIRAHSEHDDIAFNNAATIIARDFDKSGQSELASYIMALIARTRTFVPQEITEQEYCFLEKIVSNNTSLPLPQPIADDIQGLLNALSRNAGINTILFYGASGTGKTEATKQVARILGYQLYVVDFNRIIDSKLGETAKNIAKVFQEISDVGCDAIILFDEIDAIALDRINQNDVREMGRATSALLKEFDKLDTRSIIIATTNLYDKLDPALARRFDVQIDFNRYTHDDLVEIGESIAKNLIRSNQTIKLDSRTLKKVLQSCPELPWPGTLKNLIKTSVAFSDPLNPNDYLAKLYQRLHGYKPDALELLKTQGFTLREMEILTGMSRSTIARTLKE